MSLEKFRDYSVVQFCVYVCTHNLPLNIITIPYCRSPDFLITDTDIFCAVDLLNASILRNRFFNTHIKNICITGDNIIIFYTKEI